MKIFDRNIPGEREVEDVRVVKYPDGTVVEFTVVGTRKRWTSCVSLDQFKADNPSVLLEE